MKRRNRIIELTPLLDIILILLFVFIFNVTSIEAEKQNEINNMNDKIESINKNYENTIEEKNQEITNLKIQITQLEDRLERADNVNSLEKESIMNIATAMSELLNLRNEEMNELLELSSSETKEEILNRLNELIDSKTVLKEIERYNEVTKKFFYIDIMLEGEFNQIYINDKPTSTYITKYDIEQNEKQQKILEIKNLVFNKIAQVEGGFSLCLITYGVRDREVYQFAYEILEETLVEVKEKYGVEKVFLSEYNYIGGGVDE